jgi:hypothetical protein
VNDIVTPEYRYEHEQFFHTLVDSMVMWMEDEVMSRSDLYDAIAMAEVVLQEKRFSTLRG